MTINKDKLRATATRMAAERRGGQLDPAPAMAVTATDVLALLEEIDQLRESHEQVCANYNQVSYASEARGRQLDQLKAENDALRKDAERYRFVSQLAWYVDRAAYIYDIGNAKSPWAGERAPVDADDVEYAIDAAMAKEKSHD